MAVGKTTRKARSFSNVVATGPASAPIAIGKTITNYQLVLGGTSLLKSHLASIKLLANAKVIYEGNGSQIDKINAYRGITSDAAYLDLAFEDLTGLDILDRSVGCLDTSQGIVDLTCEIDIAGATAPTLKAIQYEMAPQTLVNGAPAPYAGLVAKQLRYSYNISAGGQLPLNFPFGESIGAVIKRVHVFHANMIGATVKEDSVVIFEATKADNELEQKRHKRVPQAGMFTIDFMPDGDVRKAFDTRKAKQVDWLLDFSAADAGYVIVEYLDRLGNL